MSERSGEYKIEQHDHSSDIQGGVAFKPNWSPKIVSTAAAYTARSNEVVLVPSGTFTVTLIGAAVAKKNSIIVVSNQGVGTVTVDGAGAETIDGAATQTLVQYHTITMMSTGLVWIILSLT